MVEYNVPVITMNIDGLHKKAGSKILIELHGSLPSRSELLFCDKLYNKPVLYGDVVPIYHKAYDLLENLKLNKGVLLVIGASDYTTIACSIRDYVRKLNCQIVEIQVDAEHKVREFLNQFYG